MPLRGNLDNAVNTRPPNPCIEKACMCATEMESKGLVLCGASCQYPGTLNGWVTFKDAQDCLGAERRIPFLKLPPSI